MEKEKIIELVEKNFSQREIAKALNVSQTNLRYWMNKFEVKTKINKYNQQNYKLSVEKKCPTCQEVKKIEDFYQRTSKDRKHEVGGYCKKCSNLYDGRRVKEVKIRMLEYKGCECEHCKLKLKDSHYSVFEFHHINPKEKDIKFKKIKFQKWEFIKNELDKCILLCANCHRMEHAKIEGW